MKLYPVFILAISFVILTACTPNISSDHYYAENLGRAQQVDYGKITKARQVVVASRNEERGSLAGTASGATIGSAIGGTTRVNILGALAGAVVGGITGHEIGKATGTQKAVQYIVHLDSGKNISIVQACEPLLHKGQRVMVLSGGPSRDRVVPA